MCLAHLFTYFCILVTVAGKVESASTPPEWSYVYGAADGPTNWYRLQGYSACNGNNQSPIALKQTSTKSITTAVKLTNYDSYNAKNVTITNSGHTVDIEFTYKSTSLRSTPCISGGLLNGQYKLVGFHFHWGSKSSQGSEHTINGVTYPMEGHFVHILSKYADLATARNYKDGVAVVGYMFTISKKDNMDLTSLLKYFQYVKYKDQSSEIYEPDPYLIDILPNTYRQSFYTYRGSLTTPPCSEPVIWTVYTSTVSISENQMSYFRNLKETSSDVSPSIPLVNNYRLPQSINGRPVYFYQYKSSNDDDDD